MQKKLKTSIRVLLLVGTLLSVFGPPASPVYAAPILTVAPLTWNVIGLDSNDETSGPDNFPVAVRVCNDSTTDDATNVTATFVWDDGEDLYSGHDYINLRTGSLSSIPLAGTLAAGGACADYYFEVNVKRDPGAYNKTRAYHIEISSDEGATASSPQPRELLVEYLVSQSRNATTAFELDGTYIPAGGGMALTVGNEYEIKLYGSTATNGYEQLETFINFPNTIFQILSVTTSYTADSARVPSPNDKLYSDSCLWENNPLDLDYLSCLDVGKNGGDIVVTYQIKVIGGAGTTQNLTSLIYDFSGSSFHYNADYSSTARIAYIVDPSLVTINKEFIPDQTSVGGVSTLKFKISNPNGVALENLSFTDVFPTDPGAMLTADPVVLSTSGCGTPTIVAPIGGGSFQAGQPSLAASNITVGPTGTCTISLQVTAPIEGTYDNQSSNLLIDEVDTGNYAEDSLTADPDTYEPPACTPGTILAYWDFSTSLEPTFQSGRVETAAASFGGDLLSTVPYTYVGQDGWGLSSAGEIWPENPETPPGYPLYGAAPYMQILVDTTNFTDVELVFDVGLDGNWANAADNHVYIWSEADGGGFGAVPDLDLNPVSQSPAMWHSGNTAAAASTGSATTTFRVNEIGAKPTGTAPTIVLDNVYILGCGLPEYPTLSKSFAPDPVPVGGTSTLSFTINNPNPFAVLSGIAFSDTLPEGLTVTTTAPTATCGGTLSTTAPDQIDFSGGTLAAGTNCTLSGITITAETAGPHTNISGFVSSTETGLNSGPGGSAVDTLTAILPPQISKDFSPDPIVLSGVSALSTLTFTISNPNQDLPLTDVSFSDLFPTSPGSMIVAPSPNPTVDACGSPTFVPAAGAGLVSFSGGTIAPGGTCTVSVDVAVAAAGVFNNTSSEVTDALAGAGNAAEDDLLVLTPRPGLSLQKLVSSTGSAPWSHSIGVQIDGSVYYRFVIENIGDVSLSPVSVSDPTLAGSGVDPASCVWPLSLPAPVVDNDNHIASCVLGPVNAIEGDQDNTATASGTYGGVVYQSLPSTARYKTFGLTLDKTADETVYTSSGDTLHYNYLVTNDGFAPLEGPVTIADDKSSDESCPELTSIGNGNNWLDPGESITCSATYLVPGPIPPQAVTNTATASVDGINSTPDSVTVTYLTQPTVTKAFIPQEIDVGGISLLVITLNNPGGTDLTGLEFTDTYPVGDIYNADPTNASTDCTGATLTAAAGGGNVALSGATLEAGGACTVSINVSSVTPGDHNNSIPVGGVTTDQLVSNTSAAADTLTVNSIAPTVTKTFIPDTINSAGISTLSIQITNPNNAVLTNVAFSDLFPGAGANVVVAAVPNASSDCGGVFTAVPGAGSISLSAGTIAPLASCTVSVDVTATIGGTVTNITSEVTSDEAPNSLTASDTLTVLVPSLSIIKTGTFNDESGDGFAQSGETISYEFVVANDGNLPLTSVVVSDPLLGTISCPSGNPIPSLAVNDSETCTGSYTINQSDVNAGQVDNTATADSTESGPDSDDETTILGQDPSLSIIKTGTFNDESGDGFAQPGETISYSFRVTNDGNLTLSSITVTDPLPGLSAISCPAAVLLVNQTMICSASYAVTQADIDAGQVDNTATADSSESGPDSDDETTSLGQDPTLSIVKLGTFNDESGDGMPDVGETISYAFAVSNDGNMTLTNVTVNDPLLTVSGGPTTLDVGETDNTTFTGLYTITQDDIDAGQVDNTATADSFESGPDSDSDTVNFYPIVLTKNGAFNDESGDGFAQVGETISYTFLVRNVGNLTLSGITVTDPLPGISVISCPADTLLIGQAMICSATYSITQADIDAGQVANTATADSNESGPDTSDETTTLNQDPALSLVKTGTFNDESGDGFAQVGETISYSFEVTNTGNLTLSNVAVTDPLLGSISCPGGNPIPTLAVAATVTCSGSYAITQVDINAGQVENTATADSDESGPDTSDETTLLNQNPSLALVKTGTFNDESGDGFPQVGETISYGLAVTNNGNLTLSNVVVTDPLLGSISCPGGNPIPTLAVAATVTCSGSYAVTQVDINAGQVDNTATADSDQTGPVISGEITTLEQNASLSVEKSSTTTSLSAPDTVTYNYLIRNTGNVAITGLSLSDDNDNDDMSCALSVIPVGGSTTCSATHTFTQAELDAYGSPTQDSGFLSNVVTASSVEAPDAIDRLDIPINRIFDPPFGIKAFDESGLPVLRWTMVWINDSNTAAQFAEVSDPIPPGTTFVASGAPSGYGIPGGAPAESTDIGVSCVPDLTGGTPSTTTECYYQGPTPAYPLGRIVWKGTLGPDFGKVDQVDAQNEIVISFNVTVDTGVFSVTNNATIDADLNDDGVISEDEEFTVDTVQAVWTGTLPPIPPTGFEPGVVTKIPTQLETQQYQQLGPVWLEIPSLGIRTEIVGVPLQEGAWDVTWLSKQAGWLEGSAFPSYDGNSILTAHVYLPSGYPGPFVNLNQLSWNDRIIVHVYGQQFIYQVRSNQLIQPDDPDAVRHEELPWLTLLTCKGFNPASGVYDHRVMVKAVLMEVKPDYLR